VAEDVDRSQDMKQLAIAASNTTGIWDSISSQTGWQVLGKARYDAEDEGRAGYREQLKVCIRAKL
jgi:hypothetical protein